jgi:hypothetical protein
LNFKEDIARESRGASVNATGWIRVNCPACPSRVFKHDHNKCCWVNATSGVFGCWRCGLKGKLGNYEPREIVVPDSLELGAPAGYVPLGRGPGATALSLQRARAYLAERCRPELWAPREIGACTQGKYLGRIIVPVLGDDQEWLGWVGRDWTGQALRKYTYPAGFQRGMNFYNGEALYQQTEEPVLITEGIFDALAHWPNAVAVMGKPSHWQMEALQACERPIAIVLDGDARYESWAVAAKLRLYGQRAVSIPLEPLQDPNQVPVEVLRQKVHEALTTL